MEFKLKISLCLNLYDSKLKVDSKSSSELTQKYSWYNLRRGFHDKYDKYNLFLN